MTEGEQDEVSKDPVRQTSAWTYKKEDLWSFKLQESLYIKLMV